MNEIQALLLGLVQGLTEYLPVSSSGHLEIGKMLLGTDPEAGGLTFSIVVHVATVLSTLVILWKEIACIVKGLFQWRWNEAWKYAVNILVSMIPIGVVGLLFKDTVESFYTDEHVRNMVVGVCLLVTAALLTLTHYARPRQREKLSPLHAFIIGVAQACAVLPGLSRSGSTIATGLLLGNSKQSLAQFSFLMVIPPILGEALLDVLKLMKGESLGGAELPMSALVVGFLAAFVSGCVACKWMINVVKRGKLIYFAIYCAIAGLVTLAVSMMN